MLKLTTIFALLSFSEIALGDRIECNKAQSQCSIDHLEITIEEKVVFLNEDNEVVAVGEVKNMNDSRRSIKVLKNYGRITKKSVVRLLDNRVQTIDDLEKYYNIYQAKSKWLAGGSAGFASFNVGEYLSGFEFTGFAQRSINEYFDWTGRLGVTMANGKISPNNEGVNQEAMDMTAFSFLPGISGVLFRKMAMSIRGEFDLGLAWVKATVAGDEGNITGAGYNTKVKNAFGLGARLEGSIQIDLNKKWEMGILAGISRIHNAQGTVIGASISCKL